MTEFSPKQGGEQSIWEQMVNEGDYAGAQALLDNNLAQGVGNAQPGFSGRMNDELGSTPSGEIIA